MARTGGPEVLQLTELPTPQPAPHEALVRAHAIGVNMPEVHVRRGRYSKMPPLPVVPGIEMSGTVTALGAAVTDVHIGQRVYVSARELPERSGCYAEYIAVPARALLPLPEPVDFASAATLSSYQVAWHLLNSATRGYEHRSVLITAAAGGIGSACVQLARAAGKQVIALTSTREKAAFAREQGADLALLYDNAQAEIAAATEGRGADLVLDAVAGERFPALFDLAAPLGLVVLYGYLTGWPDSAAVFEALRARFGRSPALRLFSMHTFDGDPAARRACSAALLELMARGEVRPPISDRIPLAEAARAHELLESGRVHGKLVLVP